MLRHKFDEHKEKKQIYVCKICQELVDTKSRKSHQSRHGENDLACPYENCTVKNNDKGIWVHKIMKHNYGFCFNPNPQESTELMETEVAKIEDLEPNIKTDEELVGSFKDNDPNSIPNEIERENFENETIGTAKKEEPLNENPYNFPSLSGKINLENSPEEESTLDLQEIREDLRNTICGSLEIPSPSKSPDTRVPILPDEKVPDEVLYKSQSSKLQSSITRSVIVHTSSITKLDFPKPFSPPSTANIPSDENLLELSLNCDKIDPSNSQTKVASQETEISPVPSSTLSPLKESLESTLDVKPSVSSDPCSNVSVSTELEPRCEKCDTCGQYVPRSRFKGHVKKKHPFECEVDGCGLRFMKEEEKDQHLFRYVYCLTKNFNVSVMNFIYIFLKAFCLKTNIMAIEATRIIRVLVKIILSMD